jgi:hypothetical protein
MAVSFTELVKPHLTVLRSDYSGAAGILLKEDGNQTFRTTCFERVESVLIA